MLIGQHSEKLDSMRACTAAFVQDLDDLVVEQLGTDARRVGERTLSALYVDFDGHEPLTPDRITESEAAELIRETRLAIGHLGGALSGLNSVVVEAVHELSPALEAFFGQVVDDRPPQEVLAELRQLLLGLPGIDVNALLGLLAPDRDRPESGALAEDG